MIYWIKLCILHHWLQNLNMFWLFHIKMHNNSNPPSCISWHLNHICINCQVLSLNPFNFQSYCNLNKSRAKYCWRIWYFKKRSLDLKLCSIISLYEVYDWYKLLTILRQWVIKSQILMRSYIEWPVPGMQNIDEHLWITKKL